MILHSSPPKVSSGRIKDRTWETVEIEPTVPPPLPPSSNRKLHNHCCQFFLRTTVALREIEKRSPHPSSNFLIICEAHLSIDLIMCVGNTSNFFSSLLSQTFPKSAINSTTIKVRKICRLATTGKFFSKMDRNFSSYQPAADRVFGLYLPSLFPRKYHER